MNKLITGSRSILTHWVHSPSLSRTLYVSSPLKEFMEDPKDRSRVIPWETSSNYLVSPSYNDTYGELRFWELYRRNVPGPKAETDTRLTCVKEGKLITNNPCPICRDIYLVIDYRNVRLLEQFIKDYNGEILTSKETGVCRRKHFDILVAIEKAKLYGLIDSIDPHFVEYDYNYYKPSRRSY
uniref:Small ribosomal subunit protein mS40 n=1 Tax=Lepeophtheirus salmonis TaxID=72036 RepID=D3PJG5_LEPSM|nr:28S ribosomal protein S18b, mitochondrial [Lepeophtheirus salmonis]